MTTKIQWCDETWNPITGCTPISEGCKNCYAARMAKRLRGRFGYPADDPFKPGVEHDDKWSEPVHWRKPRRVFTCSMGDLFHQDVTEELINKVVAMMVHPMSGMCHHTYMLLTKRPERIPAESYKRFTEWKNIWLGVTAENQKRAGERIPKLLEIPAVVRFVSVEPMLGPVDIKKYLRCESCLDPLVCWCRDPRLNWVICGPETGPGARPFNFEWARNLRDQCAAAGVPFFYKKHDHPDTPEDLRIAEFPK